MENTCRSYAQSIRHNKTIVSQYLNAITNFLEFHILHLHSIARSIWQTFDAPILENWGKICPSSTSQPTHLELASNFNFTVATGHPRSGEGDGRWVGQHLSESVTEELIWIGAPCSYQGGTISAEEIRLISIEPFQMSVSVPGKVISMFLKIEKQHLRPDYRNARSSE